MEEKSAKEWSETTRSAKVRKLLDEKPHFLIRWGTIIVTTIFLIALIVLSIMPIPHSQNSKSIMQNILSAVPVNK